MEKDQIEERSVSAIKNEIAKYNMLKPGLETGDKRISWDGYITVFNKNRNKKGWSYDIKVQVKGHEVKKFKKGNITFSIEIEDLKNYQEDGSGTLFFVVYMIDYQTTKIYYANLLPVDLNYILSNIKPNQKTKSIKFRPVCEATQSSLKNICLNFVENSKKQMGTPIMDLEKLSNVARVGFKVTADKDKVFDYILNNDVYSYAYLDDNISKVALPKGEMVMISHTVNADIKVGDEIYYNKYEFQRMKNGEQINIGKGVIFNLNTKKADFKFKGSLSDRIADIEFFLALVNSKKLSINGVVLDFPPYKKDINETKVIIKEWEERLTNLKLIKKTFENFNINFTLDIDKLEEEDINNLYMFVDIFGKDKIVKNKNITKTGLYNIKIAKYKILIWATISKEGIIHCYDYFGDLSDIVNLVLVREGEQPTPEDATSPYLMFTPEDILSSSNLNVESIKKSIEGISRLKKQSQYISNFMLNILNAYDQDTKRKDLLDLSEYICNKLLSYDKKSISYIINKMQIIKRKRELVEEEKAEIYNIKETLKKDSDYNMFQCGIAIVLGNKTDYEYFYNQLNKTQKKDFGKFPIINLIDK